MKLLYAGKTKDVFEKDTNTVVLQFKDDVTGTNGVFDPGANTVGLTIDGAGKSGLKLTQYFFEKINAAGFVTHYISANIAESTMTVHKAQFFGNGLEVICRFKATGSFMRRYGQYATEGQNLGAFVEVTLKDDKRNDPPITKDALDMLGILSHDEYEVLKTATQNISKLIQKELRAKGLELWDIKLEFGKIGKDNRIALIDEISGGNMRVYKDGIYVPPLELERLMLS